VSEPPFYVAYVAELYYTCAGERLPRPSTHDRERPGVLVSSSGIRGGDGYLDSVPLQWPSRREYHAYHGRPSNSDNNRSHTQQAPSYSRLAGLPVGGVSGH
jgi:hypothetical protein